MAKVDADAVIGAIERMIAFLRDWGDRDPARAGQFREFISRIKEGGLKKDLFKELDRFRNASFVKIREEIWAGQRLAGKDDEQSIDELNRAAGAIYSAMWPLEIPPTVDIRGCAGGEHVDEKFAEYRGDVAGAKEVVEKSIELVLRYSQVVADNDLEAAYAMCESGLKAVMKKSDFVRRHREAQRKWGRFSEFHIQRFASVYTDDKGRESDAKEGWKELTLKPNRRSIMMGYWITDKPAGCGGTIWVAEEDGEYGLANFRIYEWRG